jgi:hypothetical protein
VRPVPEKIAICVSDDHLDHIDEVVSRLEAAGVQVEQVLRPVGVITGSAPAPGWRALGTLTGVASVEVQRRVQLPPPDAEIQ